MIHDQMWPTYLHSRSPLTYLMRGGQLKGLSSETLIERNKEDVLEVRGKPSETIFVSIKQIQGT